MKLPNYDTHGLSVIEELGDADLCSGDFDLHDDVESLCNNRQGSLLNSVDTSVVGTSDISRVDDSCCSESDISYQILGDDSEQLLDDARF